MMWGGLGFSMLFGTPLNETFQRMSMANWKKDGMFASLFEYTIMEILVGLLSNGVTATLLYGVTYIIIAPAQQSFCGGYDGDFQVLWNVNICNSIYGWKIFNL